MRYRVFAATAALTVGLVTTSHAAEVSEQGAKDLRSVLTHYLFLDLSKSDFITVKPANNRYEIGYDLAKFFDKINSPDFSITGLQPLMMYAEPVAQGLWNIDGDNSLNVSAHSKMGPGPASDLNYTLSSLVYSGVFDPAIGYLRSLDVSGKDFKISSTTGPQKIEAGISGMNYKLVSTDTAKPGTIDIATTGTMPGFYEKVSNPGMPSMDMRAESLDFNANMMGVPAKELRDFVRFLFVHIKAKKLSKKGNETFQQLAHAAMPLFVSLDETVNGNNISIATDQGKVNLGKLVYSLKMNGLTKDSNIGFGMRAEDLKLESNAIPASYAALVPQKATIEAGIPDMNFEAAANIILNTDFSDSKKFSTDEGKQLTEAVFPNGKLTVDFPEISAVSGVYDIQISGKVATDLQQTKKYALDASILARDFDKTIAFVQDAAKTDPQLNQLSFGMMMAKGFAKTDPDGRQRWDVSVAEDGAVSVNGQVIAPAK